MSPTQCKMARAATGLSIKELAEACSVSPNTVYRFENGKDSYASTSKKLQGALEATGRIRFEGESCVCLVDDSD